MKIQSAVVLSGLIAAVPLRAAEIPQEQVDFFEKKIRPVLVENCYKCHSVAEGKSRGGLTLDSKEGWVKGGENGSPIKPGDPANSSLISSVKGEDEDSMMPPKKENKRLTAEQINDLTEWVKMGAPDPRTGAAKKLTGLSAAARAHWAYQAVQKPAVPKVNNAAWPYTPVDNFVMAKLDEKKMMPTLNSDPEALLRRAYFDLIGLPPGVEEIRKFALDCTKDPRLAFAKVVDQLLESPQYGERWGRYWLNTARYSDTTGDRGGRREGYKMGSWTYRDYVVRSLNEDKPYDRFIIEQLAGDQLADMRDPRTVAGLGFLTVGQRTGGADDIIDDRIDTVTKGFLAMTVSCARCHDHKFDPIPTTDYYSMHGIFSSITEPEREKLPVISQSTKEKEKDFATKFAEMEKASREFYYKLLGEQNSGFRQKAGAYVMVAALGGRMSSAENQKTVDEIVEKAGINRQGSVSRAIGGALRRHASIFGPALAMANSGSAKGGGTVHPVVASALADLQPKTIDDMIKVYDRVFANLDTKAAEFIRYRRAATTDKDEVPLDKDTAELVQVPMSISPGFKLTAAGLRQEVNGFPQGLDARNGGWKFAAIERLELTHPGAPGKAMIVMDKTKPMDSPVYVRGLKESPGDKVPRRFLEVLSGGDPKPFKIGSGRLELAKAIADKKNPLTARVMVNRVWMYHFGEGFVRTPDDLGTMAEPPSHPELLDYLSSYFMDQGWSFKKLHKLIMLSRVYQTSSRMEPAMKVEWAKNQEIDPYNRLLWRANVRRLDFESFRDSLLTMSGQLEKTVGGPAVNITDEPYSYRRSVYGYVDRGNLPELMAAFDFSNPQAPNSKRSTTIVPQQALFLMNSAMSVDVARKILARPEVKTTKAGEVMSPAYQLIRNVYWTVLQRSPRADEYQLAEKFIVAETKMKAQTEAAAKPLLERAEKKENARRAALQRKISEGTDRETDVIPETTFDPEKGELLRPSVPRKETLTPWETFVHALLMSNEAVYVN